MRQQSTEIKTQTPESISLDEVVETHRDLQTEVADLMGALTNARPRDLERINLLLSNALKAARGEIGDTEVKTQTNRDSRLVVLMDKYQIKVLGEGKVSFNLKGSSRIEFLREVQALAPLLHDQNAIWSERLNDWAIAKDFIDILPIDAPTIAINGKVKGTANMSRSQQESFLKDQGLSMPKLCDLAVAHAAYLIATGKNLFGSNAVRALDGVLTFHGNGLDVDEYDDDREGYTFVSASAALPSKNRMRVKTSNEEIDNLQ